MLLRNRGPYTIYCPASGLQLLMCIAVIDFDCVAVGHVVVETFRGSGVLSSRQQELCIRVCEYTCVS